MVKFKKNADCNTKLAQWLWLIDGSEEEKVEMSAKENEEVNKTVEELNKLSQDPDEVAKYEEREWSIMRYNVEMETNRKIGEKEGEARGVKIGEKRGRKEGEKTTWLNNGVADSNAVKKLIISQQIKLNMLITKIQNYLAVSFQNVEKFFLVV